MAKAPSGKPSSLRPLKKSRQAVMPQGFRVQAFRFRVEASGLWGLGFRPLGFGFGVRGSGLWVYGLGLRVCGLGCRVLS